VQSIAPITFVNPAMAPKACLFSVNFVDRSAGLLAYKHDRVSIIIFHVVIA